MRKDNYEEKYGDVPKEYYDRFIYALKKSGIKDKEVSSLQKRIREILRMDTEEIHFVIYMTPKATPRPRIGKFGRFYVQGAMDNSKLFKDFMKSQFPEMHMITTPCRFNIDLYLPIPSGLGKMEKILAELRLIKVISKPDWDNLGKTYSDMVQKHLLQEDSLVYDARVRKFYSFRPRVEITMEYDTKYDCKHSKRTVEKWKTYNEEKSINRDII